MNSIKIVSLAALALLMVACGGDDSKKLQKLIAQRDKLNEKIKTIEQGQGEGVDGANANTLQVVVKEIKPSGFNHYVDVQGRIDGEENVSVSAQMGGIVSLIHVKAGQKVSKGQLLASLDASVLEQSLEEIKNQLSFASELFNRQKNLWDQKIGSEVQYLSAKNQKESLEKRLATLREQVDMTRLKSPINGTVEELNLKIGQMLAPGIPVIRVINFTTVKAVAEVGEAYAPYIKAGKEVIVYLPDLQTEIKAKLGFSSRYINMINRTFQIEVPLNPAETDFRANMIAVLKINDYKNDSALVVPANLMQSDTEGNFVFAAREENGKWIAKKVAIKQGLNYNGEVEIISGLKQGEKVIIQGYQAVVEGQQIKF